MTRWTHDEDDQLRRWYSDTDGRASFVWMAAELNKMFHGGRAVRSPQSVSRRDSHVTGRRDGQGDRWKWKWKGRKRPAVDAGYIRAKAKSMQKVADVLSDAVHALDVLTGALRSVKERGHIPAPVFLGMENMSNAVVHRLRKTREGL